MKGTKCRIHSQRFWGFLLAVFLPVLACTFTSKTASALELTGGNALVLDSGTIVTDVQTRNGTKSHSDLIFDFPGTESFVYGLTFDYSSTAIPSTDYLLSFDVTYISSFGSAGGSNYTGHFRYDGLESQTMNKVFESCVDNHNTPITNGGITQYIGEGQVTCSYIFFAHSDSYTSFTSRNDSRIWYGISATNNRIIVSPGFVRGISWNGLTQDDRDWLEEVIQDSSTDVSSVISKINEVKSEQQATTRAVEAQTRQQHEDYENEVDREEAKEDELEDQKDDLNISAQNPGNPFASLFNVSGCASLPVFSQWFHQDSVTQVCSPYPEQVRPVIEFVSSVIVIGLLIRIYFKNFKGGYSS